MCGPKMFWDLALEEGVADPQKYAPSRPVLCYLAEFGRLGPAVRARALSRRHFAGGGAPGVCDRRRRRSAALQANFC